MDINLSKETSIGCEITSLELKHASPAEFEAVKEAVYKHKIAVVRNQNMSEAEFCELSKQIGEPVPYLQENYHHPDYPLIFVSSNVQKNGKKMGVARTGGYWHADTSFLDKPVSLTMLYPQIIPNNTKRTTLFIDLERAFAELPESIKSQLEGKRFIHSGRWKYKVRPEDVGTDLSEILAMIHQVQPPVSHPAVITHPVTGKKSIYASRGFTIGIEGMKSEQEEELLANIFEHIEQNKYISEFQWQLGNIILWDNRFLAHKAGRLNAANDPLTGNVELEEETLVYRIIMRDGYPLCVNN